MVESSVHARTLDREHIEIILYHTKHARITLRIRAYRAEWMSLIRHTMTIRAFLDILMKIREGFCEIIHIRWMGFEEKKGKFCCSFFTDSRKIVNHIDDSFERFGHSCGID